MEDMNWIYRNCCIYIFAGSWMLAEYVSEHDSKEDTSDPVGLCLI